MNIKNAFSIKINIADAVAEIRRQMEECDARLVVFFASPVYPPEQLAAAMADAFPEAVTFGCSTAGEIASGRMLSHSLVAMAFGAGAIKGAKIEVLENVGDTDRVDRAFTVFANHFRTPMATMDPARYVGLILIDGLSHAEERVMDRIGDLTNVNFIGGSAGDDLRFASTHIYANGKSYSNAAVLALLEPALPFSFLKTQSFSPLPCKLVVTRANEAERKVIEFDHKPAAIAYADALGTSVELAAERFMDHPLGLIFQGEPFVRSPQMIKDGSIVFYCSMKEGMELSLLQSTDIIADTKSALESARTDSGEISAIINFNCILRTLELRQKGQTGAYGELFAKVPTIGFSTYGEQFIGHINQTATMLLFHQHGK